MSLAPLRPYLACAFAATLIGGGAAGAVPAERLWSVLEEARGALAPAWSVRARSKSIGTRSEGAGRVTR